MKALTNLVVLLSAANLLQANRAVASSFENLVDSPTEFSLDFVVGPNFPNIIEEMLVTPVSFTHQAGVLFRRVTPNDGGDAVFQVDLAQGGSGGPRGFDLMYILSSEHSLDLPLMTGEYVSRLTGDTIAYSVTGHDTGGSSDGQTTGHLTLKVTAMPDEGSTLLCLALGAGAVALRATHRRSTLNGPKPSVPAHG